MNAYIVYIHSYIQTYIYIYIYIYIQFICIFICIHILKDTTVSHTTCKLYQYTVLIKNRIVIILILRENIFFVIKQCGMRL